MPYLVSSSCFEFCSWFAEAYKNALVILQLHRWEQRLPKGQSSSIWDWTSRPCGWLLVLISCLVLCRVKIVCRVKIQAESFTVPVFQEQRCSTLQPCSQQVWWICLSSELLSEWRVWLDLQANQNVQHWCIAYWLISNLKSWGLPGGKDSRDLLLCIVSGGVLDQMPVKFQNVTQVRWPSLLSHLVNSIRDISPQRVLELCILIFIMVM